MEALRAELTCPVCLDLYQHPLVLNCHHNVCRSCLRQIVTTSPSSILTPGCSADEDLSNATFSCPICRSPTSLNQRGLESLHHNQLLSSIISRYLDVPAQPIAVELPNEEILRCQMCEVEPGLPAERSCVECGVLYCETCFITCHRMKGPLSTHTIILPSAAAVAGGLGSSSNQVNKDILCSEHVKEKINMYCLDCERLVCSLCKLVGAHKIHEVGEIMTSYRNQKETMASNMSKVNDLSKKLEVYIKDLEAGCEDIKLNGETRKSEICSEFEALQMMLERRKDRMLSCVDQHTTKRLSTIHQELVSVKDLLSKHESLTEFAAEVLKETDQTTFLQFANSLHRRLFDCVKNFPALSNVTVSEESRLLTDFSYELEVIESINFLTTPGKPRIESSICISKLNSIIVRWASPLRSAVSSYDVEYRVSSESDWSVMCVQSAVTQCQITDLEFDQHYAIRLRALNKAGYGPYTDEFTLSTMPEPPPVPILLKDVCSVDQNSIHLVWDQPPSHSAVDSYIIDYSMESSEDAWTTVRGIEDKDYLLSSLEWDATYHIRVRSVNRAGVSEVSSILTVQTWPMVPEPPIIQSEHSIGESNRFQLQWVCDPESSRVDQFVIEYRASNQGEEWKAIDAQHAQCFILRDLAFDTDYIARVRAINKSGSSDYSESVDFTTGSPPIKFALDSQTSHVNLRLSNNNLTAQYDRPGAKNRMPADDAFIGAAFNVLGDKSVTKGKHYWEVKVKNKTADRIGVAYRNTSRDALLGDTDRSWAVGFVQGDDRLYSFFGKKRRRLQYEAPTRPFSIGILLDMDDNYVAFFHADARAHLHTFRQAFSDPVYPALTVWPNEVTVVSGLQIPDHLML